MTHITEAFVLINRENILYEERDSYGVPNGKVNLFFEEEPAKRSLRTGRNLRQRYAPNPNNDPTFGTLLSQGYRVQKVSIIMEE